MQRDTVSLKSGDKKRTMATQIHKGQRFTFKLLLSKGKTRCNENSNSRFIYTSALYMYKELNGVCLCRKIELASCSVPVCFPIGQRFSNWGVQCPSQGTSVAAPLRCDGVDTITAARSRPKAF